MSYQSHRDCATRYKALCSLLDRYQRPITVLELGPAEGYFAERIARDYDATVAMVERHARLNRQLPGTLFLNHEPDAEALEQLGLCEHFDVVLAMSVLHHFKKPGRALKAALKLGDHTVVETPRDDDTVAWNGRGVELWGLLEPMEKETLCWSPGLAKGSQRPLWHIETPRDRLFQPDLARARQHGPEPSETMGDMRIRSNYEEKTVHFERKGEERPWVPGINLLTYLWWNGIWPERKTVAAQVAATPLDEGHPHGDMRPWNFVINRHGCHLIDNGDNRQAEDDAVALRKTVRAVHNGGRYGEAA